jgi:pimeloyl-ACP methyl ester carboxylesterase
MRPFRSHRIPLRGLEHHVLTWGDPEAPKLFLVHGWMDVGASFQFLVDVLRRDWYAIAPDLRGYGRTAWQPQGYWFPDYVADVEALVDALALGESVNLVGHSLGGNIVMHYAGVRPQRVRTLVSLEGFGIPAEAPSAAPAKFAKWLDALNDPPTFARYRSLAAVADRLQKNNRRLPRDRALFLAHHWAETAPDGTAALVSDPRHKMPFPTVYRIEEVYAVWNRIKAPVLWVAADDSDIPAWLNDTMEDGDAADGFAGIRRRMAQVSGARLARVAGAGHMVHHDQPEAVAAAIESFLAAV